MIVCVCHRVSDRHIVQGAAAGCVSFDELQDELRVGTACGACVEHARAAFDQARAAPCRGAGRCAGAPAVAEAAVA